MNEENKKLHTLEELEDDRIKLIGAIKAHKYYAAPTGSDNDKELWKVLDTIGNYSKLEHKKPKSTFLYQLTINSDQALLIAGALDFWTRCHGGQLEELQNINLNVDCKDEIKALKKIMFPHLGTYASDFRFKFGREAFNLRKTIEHAVYWNEKPLTPGQFKSVNYDGPIAGWWESDTEAKMLVYSGDEAVRVRDEVDRTSMLGKELEEVFATTDIQDATKLAKTWKKAFDKCQKKKNLSGLGTAQEKNGSANTV